MHDVIVVGSGLAGSIAASVLAKRGLDVALVDRHTPDKHPPEFRAEQIVGGQVAALRHLGILEPLTDGVREIRIAEASRRGKVLGRSTEPHYGLTYTDIVLRARQAVPDSVTRVTGRLSRMTFTDTVQAVSVDTGEFTCQQITGRLVIIATGLTPLEKWGLGREVISVDHSLSLGFDIVTDYPYVHCAYGERMADRIDYLTVFPMGELRANPETDPPMLRANLFAYQNPRGDWATAFKQDPARILAQAFPKLHQSLGDWRIASRVDARAITLYRTLNTDRPGVVVIGDAYQTSCPAVGSGIGRLLTDIDVLCNKYVPKWFAKCGIDKTMIGQFYADPIKRAQDAEALRAAAYRRDSATQTSLSWRMHRSRVAIQRKVKHAVRLTETKSIPSLVLGRAS